jgi:Ca-activated chloride channel family protein
MASFWNNTKFDAVILSAVFFLSRGAEAAGLMTPADSHLPPLQIQQHHVSVTIGDGYAITSIDQHFYNPHDQVLEAMYSFPVPEDAAVGEFTYWIDDKPITGEVVPREQGREIYDSERAQGREVALVEQEGYHSFDTRVYPVRANDSVHIRLVYLQPVHADLGIGRYVYPLEEGGVDEERLSFWNYQEVVQGTFSFNLRMRSSYPIEEFRLPGHAQAKVKRVDEHSWDVSFSAGQAHTDDNSSTTQTATDAFRLDRDIVVYWRHRQGLPGAVDMITHKAPGSDRGTFMLTVTPGDDLATLQGGRDWVFVLDFSGSMKGKYHSLVEGVRKGLGRLGSGDRFRIVLFNNGTRELTQGFTPVSEASVRRYARQLDGISPQGGTNLYAGLERGFRGLDADRASAVVLVTDGVANVGTTEKKAFLELLDKHDIRLFTFVMGNSANRPLLEGMASVSNGFASSISNGDDISGRLMQAVDKLGHEAYRDIDITFHGVKVRDLTPSNTGSLYRGQQLVVFGHYWGDGPADLEISGKVGHQSREYQAKAHFPQQSTLFPEVERLWAFATIEDLQRRMHYLGADPDSEQAIVDLAMEYGLVTPYTSMVVVRDEIFEQYDVARRNSLRVANEHSVREQRAAGQVTSHRQDAAQPAFSGTRAYPTSGGGAAGPWLVTLLLPLLLLELRSRLGGRIEAGAE